MNTSPEFIKRALSEITKLHSDLQEALETNAALAAENETLRRDAENAQTDDLTGLYGRRWLRRFWNSLQHPADELSAVLVIDVDKFKQVNDRYGHHVGDHALTHIADAIRRNCLYAIRTGGDEFLALVGRRVSPADAARRIASDVRRVLRVDGINLILSVSIGACKIDDGNHDLSAMIDHADREMYAAKESERGLILSI